jgi:hypothetical protein
MLNLAFYGKRANSLEPGDPELAHEGTLRVRTQILDSDGVALLDSATVAAAEASPRAVAAAQGKPCNVVMACARAVGQELGVPWVVTGKISKTSNLIWIFTGQLINVATGELVMDDEYAGAAVRRPPNGRWWWPRPRCTLGAGAPIPATPACPPPARGAPA